MTERDTALHIVSLIDALARMPDEHSRSNLRDHLPWLMFANLRIIRGALVRAYGGEAER